MGLSEELAIESVDFLFKENGPKHRTDKFEQPEGETMKAILRRGQPFKLKINFKGKKLHFKYSDLWIFFTLGSDPKESDGTKGMAKIKFEKSRTEIKPTGWYAVLEKIEANSLTIEVNSPKDAPVSLWSFYIGGKTKDGKKELFAAPKSVWLLFNPWLEDDLVYMPETELLEEYVMSDVGKVWTGSKVEDATGMPWVYGQFDKCVLPVCATILKHVPESERGDPVKVVRIISKLVNNNDGDGGILKGNWQEITDGTSPFAWTGSIAILEEYNRTKLGVKWGQCWVFAAVVTTICRALGIPCRNNTNFQSGHDSDGTCILEFFVDEDNKPTNAPGRADSIWNYHVWNDAWMARPDLPSGYGGWQAVDATPQEKSDGYYQCGPAPVEAIRNGLTQMKYDVGFLLAEVNADVLYLKEDPDSEKGYIKIDHYKRDIGQALFTKKPGVYDPNGESDRVDIMSLYKHAEGTAEERASYFTGVSTTNGRRLLSIPSISSGEILIELSENEKVTIGSNFEVQLKVTNVATEDRKMRIWLDIESIYYNGIKGHLIKESEDDYVVKAKNEITVSLKVEPEEYLDKLVGQGMVKIKVTAYVPETKLTWYGEDDMQIIKPPLKIDVPTEIKKGVATSMTLKFTNPLKKHLTNAKFNICSPGLLRPTTMKIDNAEPLGEVQKKVKLISNRVGSFTLVATFDSTELQDIRGSVVIKCI